MGLTDRVAPRTQSSATSYPLGYRGKRAFDVIVGSALSLLTLPVVVVLAAVSAAKFRCWPFFVQSREGFGGNSFRFVKIRSLPRHAPAYADREQLGSVDVSRWGELLRNRHLDELPQFWLVVAGRMSLVGPRPMIRSICERMDHHHRYRRNAARPGVTGLWQISEDNARLVLEATHYDERYLRATCLGLDVWVLAVTALQVLGRRRLQPQQMPVWVQCGLGFDGETARHFEMLVRRRARATADVGAPDMAPGAIPVATLVSEMQVSTLATTGD